MLRVIGNRARDFPFFYRKRTAFAPRINVGLQRDFPAGLDYRAVVRVRTPAPLALAHDRRGSTRTVIDNSSQVEPWQYSVYCIEPSFVLARGSVGTLFWPIAKFQKVNWLRES